MFTGSSGVVDDSMSVVGCWSWSSSGLVIKLFRLKHNCLEYFESSAAHQISKYGADRSSKAHNKEVVK